MVGLYEPCLVLYDICDKYSRLVHVIPRVLRWVCMNHVWYYMIYVINTHVWYMLSPACRYKSLKHTDTSLPHTLSQVHIHDRSSSR